MVNAPRSVLYGGTLIHRCRGPHPTGFGAAPIQTPPAHRYTGGVTPDFRASAAAADLIADHIRARRLTNSVLAIAATWLLRTALADWPETEMEPWLTRGALALTLGAAAFVVWSVTRGDRRVWAKAFRDSAGK